MTVTINYTGPGEVIVEHVGNVMNVHIKNSAAQDKIVKEIEKRLAEEVTKGTSSLASMLEKTHRIRRKQ